mgnify:CR=1 FL=1
MAANPFAALFDETTLVRLRKLRLASGRVQRGGARGERLSRQFGSGQEFGTHRPYAHGDDLRRVDWNVYGRLDQLVLKLFEQPGQLRVLLVADDAPTMDFGAVSKWLAARRLLAAVGLIALAGSERVQAGCLSGGPVETFDGTGEDRLLEWFTRLAPLAATDGAALRSLLQSRGRDTVLVLASDFQRREPALELLQEARRRGARAMAISISCTEETRPTLHGLTRLQPIGADGIRLRVDERVLAAYHDELTRWREGTAKAVRALGAAFMEFDSGQPIEPLVREMLRAGLVRA